MLIEVVIKRKPQRPLMVLAVVFVSIGPVLTQLGSSMDASALGLIMQLLAVFGSASKSVFGHSILTQHKKRLGEAVVRPHLRAEDPPPPNTPALSPPSPDTKDTDTSAPQPCLGILLLSSLSTARSPSPSLAPST